MIKYFRFSYDFVLWGISYRNLTMLLATIPQYKSDAKKGDDTVKAGSPEQLSKYLKLE